VRVDEKLTHFKVCAKKAFYTSALSVVHCGNRVCCRETASY